MTTIISREKLFKRAKNDKIRQWVGELFIIPAGMTEPLKPIFVSGREAEDLLPFQPANFVEGNKPVLSLRYGYVGGKQAVSFHEVNKVPRGWEDVFAFAPEFLQQYKRKKVNREGYFLSQETAETNVPLRPMLLGNFDKRPKKSIEIKKYMLQPKLDGVRMIIHPEGGRSEDMAISSRTGHPYIGFNHIIDELRTNPMFSTRLFIDGELYNHKFGLQRINQIAQKSTKISREDQKLKETLVLHIFDIIDLDNVTQPAEEREAFRNAFFDGWESRHTSKVPTFPPVRTNEELETLRTKVVEKGYEGLVMRHREAPYLFGNRASWEIIKVKRPIIEMVRLIRVEAETAGNRRGAIVWVCERNGKEFTVVPKGTIAERKRLYAEAMKSPEDFIDTMVKIKYYDLTADDIPRHAVGYLS